MVVKFPEGEIPEGLYVGGLNRAAEAAELAMRAFGVEKPATLYYPASNGDISFLALQDVRVIHVDPQLGEQEIKGFQAIGAEAYKENAMTWQPDSEVDAVAFINAAGLYLPAALEQSRLKVGGLVLNGAGWGGSRELYELPELELVGVIETGHDGPLEIDREALDDYFAAKVYEELDDRQREYFGREWAGIVKAFRLEADLGEAEAYELLKLDDNEVFRDYSQYKFPPKKAGGLHVFQKR